MIPNGPDAITSEWLTKALRINGLIGDAVVTSFESQLVGEGLGLVGQVARLTLRYDQPNPDAPCSLIAKFPAANPENRSIGRLFRFYEREIQFYENVASKIDLRTPLRFHSAMDVEAGEFVLLLEDFVHARVGDQVAGWSLEDAEIAIRHLARFHAAWWESPHLASHDWMPRWNQPGLVELVQKAYEHAWTPFVEKFEKLFPPAILGVCEELGTKIPEIAGGLGKPPLTIVHGDYRIDNLLFAPLPDGAPLAVIDWQITAKGRGVFDVAYLMCQSGAPDLRKTHELELLRTYHRLLTRYGVTGYEFDACLTDYRKSILYCLVYMVIACGSLDTTNERGRTLVNAVLERTIAAVLDFDVASLMR